MRTCRQHKSRGSLCQRQGGGIEGTNEGLRSRHALPRKEATLPARRSWENVLECTILLTA